MSGYKDPKVVIPPYTAPVGTQMTVRNREGILTYEKTEEGFEVVAFEAALPPKG